MNACLEHSSGTGLKKGPVCLADFCLVLPWKAFKCFPSSFFVSARCLGWGARLQPPEESGSKGSLSGHVCAALVGRRGMAGPQCLAKQQLQKTTTPLLFMPQQERGRSDFVRRLSKSVSAERALPSHRKRRRVVATDSENLGCMNCRK